MINTCPADVNICQDLIFHEFNNIDNLVFAAYNEAIKIYDISQCRVLETVMKQQSYVYDMGFKKIIKKNGKGVE